MPATNCVVVKRMGVKFAPNNNEELLQSTLYSALGGLWTSFPTHIPCHKLKLHFGAIMVLPCAAFAAQGQQKNSYQGI